MAVIIPTLLSSREVAVHLGISYDHLRWLRSQGGHPLLCEKAIIVGRSPKWKDHDVADYINSLAYENQE